MKRLGYLIAFMCLASIQVVAQSTYWKWGNSHCTLNSGDSAFLVNIEKMMWNHERLTNSFVLYEGFHGGGGYRIRMSKVAMETCFADTNVAKLRFTNIAELLTVWNVNADTCWIIGFEPMISIRRNTWYRSPEIWFDTTCYVHIPLFTYKTVVAESDMLRLRRLTVQSFAEQFHGFTSSDTVYRIVRFMNDSNEYLPQASYRHMGEIMESGMFAGKLGVYRDRQLSIRMSKREIEQSFARWDSTITVEDPNKPGTYILAPIKVEQHPSGIVIYERWVPSDCGIEKHEFPNYRPQPYLRYIREVLAYGMALPDKHINWVSPEHFNSWFNPAIFNRAPYEESFRAERFERMHIALEP